MEDTALKHDYANTVIDFANREIVVALKRLLLSDPDGGSKWGHHLHTCQECGTTWEHDGRSAYDDAVTHEDFNKLHECPSCHRPEFMPNFAAVDKLLPDLRRAF